MIALLLASSLQASLPVSQSAARQQLALVQDPMEAHQLYSFTGVRQNDQFGASLASAGDVDRDGVVDVLVGAPDPYGQGGYVVLYSGATGRVVHQWHSQTPSDWFGAAICGGADVDADGVPDVVVGAPWSNNTGSIHVYSGATGQLIASVWGARTYEGFGGALAFVGDINRDGFADVAVAAPAYAGAAGRIDVISGAWLARQAGPKYLHRIRSKAPGTYFGAALAAGDLDGDGICELVVGAPNELQYRGAVHVHSLVSGQRIATLYGQSAWDGLGTTVCIPGDLDGDGFADVAAGAPWCMTGTSVGMHTGYVRMWSVRQNTVLYDLQGVGNMTTGRALAAVGDVDSDGYADVLVGCLDDWVLGQTRSKVQVVSGRAGQILQEFLGTTLGSAVAGLGDLNGDGHLDFAVGAPLDPGQRPGAMILSSIPLALRANVSNLPVAAGGSQRLVLDAGSACSNQWYLFLGSTSGTWPGSSIGSVHVPLNNDVYFRSLLALSNAGPIANGLGQLDAAGHGRATFILPPGMPGIANISLYHAFVVLDLSTGQVTLASGDVPVTFN